MKRAIYIILLISCIAYSQEKDKTEVYQKDKKHSISILSGYSTGGYGVSLAYQNYFNSNGNYFELSALAGFAEEQESGFEIPVSYYTLNVGYFKELKIMSNLDADYTLSIGAGLSGGYELVNEGNETLANGIKVNDESKVIYGPFGVIDLDIYLSNSVSLVAKGGYYFHVNSDIGKSKIFAGVGIKYTIF